MLYRQGKQDGAGNKQHSTMPASDADLLEAVKQLVPKLSGALARGLCLHAPLRGLSTPVTHFPRVSEVGTRTFRHPCTADVHKCDAGLFCLPRSSHAAQARTTRARRVRSAPSAGAGSTQELPTSPPYLRLRCPAVQLQCTDGTAFAVQLVCSHLVPLLMLASVDSMRFQQRPRAARSLYAALLVSLSGLSIPCQRI